MTPPDKSESRAYTEADLREAAIAVAQFNEAQGPFEEAGLNEFLDGWLREPYVGDPDPRQELVDALLSDEALGAAHRAYGEAREAQRLYEEEWLPVRATLRADELPAREPEPPDPARAAMEAALAVATTEAQVPLPVECADCGEDLTDRDAAGHMWDEHGKALPPTGKEQAP